MGTAGSVGDIVEGLTAGFAALAEVDASGLTEVEVGELVQATQRVRSLADAACVVSAGALDVSKAWASEGARSAAAWMGWRCGIHRARAVVFLRCARELRDMPVTGAALVAGEITTDHVRVLVDARQVCPEAFAAQEGLLVERATGLRFGQLERVLRYWRDLHEPDGAEAQALAVHQRREAHASTSFEATVVLDALLDPVGGAIFVRELQRLEQDLFEADWAKARERLGDQACAGDLARTPRQRRADALVAMAERSAARPPDATEARVLLQVLAGHETVNRLCELSNGQVLTPGQLLPLLDRADVERVIFDGPSKVIDVGVRRRLFTGGTRTAVLARDRGCTHPSCDLPLDRCEIDHIIPYEAGGPTIQANGQCHCAFHNRRKGRQPPPAA